MNSGDLIVFKAVFNSIQKFYDIIIHQKSCFLVNILTEKHDFW